ncbi:MAG: hypothetical protein LBQ88_03690, partial [Treponema sp.]|nr:hypothetical protein [Treponema sp.]
MKDRIHSISIKLLLPIFVCFVIFALSLIFTINIFTSSTSAASFKAGIDRKDNLVYSLIDEQIELLEKKARYLAGDAGIIAVLTAEDHSSFQSQLDAMVSALDVDGIALVDQDGYLVINSGAAQSEGVRYVRTIVSYTEGRDCITRMYSLGACGALVNFCIFMQKFRLTGLLWEFARYKFAINCKFIR